MFSDYASAAAVFSGVPVLSSGFEPASSPLPPKGKGQKRKKAGEAAAAASSADHAVTATAAAAATTTTTAKKKATPLRLSQLSKAEYAANVGARLAVDVPEDQKETRVLEARDYRGIHLYADPQTGVVYNPDDIMAGVIDPRPLDPDVVAQLGPWTPSTGLRVAAAALPLLPGEEDE